MGIFDKKQSLSRGEFRSSLRRSSLPVPGTGGKKYSQKNRVALEKEVFSSQYGGQISSRDYKDALGKMKRTRNRTKDPAKKKEIQQKINFLERLA